MDIKTIQHSTGLRFDTRPGKSDAEVIREVIDWNAYHLDADEDVRTVLDIGANCGAFSVYAAKMFPNSRIISYEPEPENFDVLGRNIALNGLTSRIKPWKIAVSNRRGVDTITRQCGNSRLGRTIIRPIESDTTECQTITLADAVEQNAIDVCDLFKLDAEWSEFEILDAPEGVMRRFRAIAMEPHGTDVPQSRMDEMFTRLEKTHTINYDHGYVFAVLRGQRCRG